MAKATPVRASTIGYRAEIGAPQWRHLPRSSNHDSTGMLSRGATGVLHSGQADGGDTMDFPMGTR